MSKGKFPFQVLGLLFGGAIFVAGMAFSSGAESSGSTAFSVVFWFGVSAAFAAPFLILAAQVGKSAAPPSIMAKLGLSAFLLFPLYLSCSVVAHRMSLPLESNTGNPAPISIGLAIAVGTLISLWAVWNSSAKK